VIREVRFYRTSSGHEPVCAWLLRLPREDRRAVGEDLKTVQLGWPVGMPLVRKLEPGLWEVRARTGRGAARVLFTVEDGTMVLLHAFLKRSPKAPAIELAAARQRLAQLRRDRP
jgi:phage-related protein